MDSATNGNCRIERLRSNEEEMYSYTNAGCFFCHKEQSVKGAGDGDDHQEMTTVNIKNIVPYLNIKSAHVDNESEFSVNLCFKCSSLSVKLKESVGQMEMAKREVNQQLQELQQVLNESSKKEGEEGSTTDARGRALQVSRNAAVTTENISYQKEIQLLGVMNQKSIVCKNPVVPDLIEHNSDFSLATGVPPNFSGSDADCIIKTEAENGKITKWDTPAEWIAELMKQSESRFKHKRRIDTFYCPFCEDDDKYKRGLTRKLRGHLLATHPEQFFIQKMSPTLSVDIIRNHLRRILREQVSEMKPENPPLKSTTKKVLSNALCQICNRKCTNGESSRKYHFILNHYTLLEEKLMTVEITAVHQTAPEYDSSKTFLNSINPALQKILSNLCREKPGSMSTNPKRFNCGICNSGKYQPKSYVFRHLLYSHMDIIFASKRLSDISQMDFKNCCTQVLAAGSNLNNNEDFVCSFCEFKHHDRYHIRNHLVVEHSDILEERLVRFQEEALSSGYIQPMTDEAAILISKPRRKRKSIKRPGVTMSVDVDTKPVKSELVENIFAKFSTRIGWGEALSEGYRCEICHGPSLRTLYSKADIEKHLVHDHPDLFFPRQKLPQISQDKFQDYCKTVTRDRSNYVIQYKNGVLCSFCGWKCRDNRTVRRHIMLMHHNVLEDKLECLQGKKGRTVSKGRTSTEIGFDTGPNKVKRIKFNYDPATSRRRDDSKVASSSRLGSATTEMGRIARAVMGPQGFTVPNDNGQTGSIDFCDPHGAPSYSFENVSQFIDESYEIEYAMKMEETNEPDESCDQDANDWEIKPDPNCCEVLINEEDSSVGVGNEIEDDGSMMSCEEEEPVIKIENDYQDYII